MATRSIWRVLQRARKHEHRLTAPLRFLIAGALCFAACQNPIGASYQIEIVGPLGQAYFDGAVRATMEVAGREVASVNNLQAGRPFDLTAASVNPNSARSGNIRVKAFDAAGKLVAFGQTPDLDFAIANHRLRIFVGRPGTFGTTLGLPLPVRHHVAAAVEVASAGTSSTKLTIAVLGLGEIRKTVAGAPIDNFSNSLHFYHPLLHEPVPDVASSGPLEGMPQGRSEAAAVALPGGTLLVFGGLSRTGDASTTRLSGQADFIQFGRVSFQTVLSKAPTSFHLDSARRRATVLAMVESKVFAIGGIGDTGPLDTVVEIATNPPSMPGLLMAKMATPRAGHTATAVIHDRDREILVFGGGSAGTTVAEILDVAGARFIQPTGDAGPQRRGHVAIPLGTQDGRVLILGGIGPDGLPIDSTLIYFPAKRAFETGPIKLKIPRSNFAAFVVEEDVVIASGQDKNGNPIGTAEVYDRTTLALVAEPAVRARGGATSTVLPGSTVVLMGGERGPAAGGNPDRVPDDGIEIYQPRRP